MAAAHDARHTGQAAWIAVGLVQRQAVFLADGVQVVHPLAVLCVVRGVHPHDGVQAFPAAVHQRRAGEFQLADDGLLLFQLHIVALDKGVAVVGHVVVAAAALHRVEAYPRARRGVTVADDFVDIAVVAQLVDELPGRAVPAALCGGGAAVPQVAFGYVSHVFFRLKQGLQVAHQLVGRVPLGGDGQLLHIQPVRVHDHAVTAPGRGVDDIVPVQGVARRPGPAMVAGQLEDAVLGHRVGIAVEAAPLAGTFAPVVSSTVAGAPLLPTCDRESGLLQPHAHHRPFLIGQAAGVDKVQCF